MLKKFNVDYDERYVWDQPVNQVMIFHPFRAEYLLTPDPDPGLHPGLTYLALSGLALHEYRVNYYRKAFTFTL